MRIEITALASIRFRSCAVGKRGFALSARGNDVPRQHSLSAKSGRLQNFTGNFGLRD